MLGLIDNISIGLSPEMSNDKRHGVAWFQDHTGNMHKLPFRVDKPSRIDKPSWLTIQVLFEQIRKMGFIPVNLEFINNTRHVIYTHGRIRPIFFQPR